MSSVLKVLTSGLFAFLKHRLQIARCMTLHGLQARKHVRVQYELFTNEGFVELFAFILPELLHAILHHGLADFMLKLDGIQAAALLTGFGPGGSARSSIARARGLSACTTLSCLCARASTACGTTGHLSAVLLQTFDKLGVLLDHHFGKLTNLIVLSLLRGELAQLDLTHVVDQQH